MGAGWPDIVGLRYRDAHGEESQRAVEVSAVRPHGADLMVEGICQLRRAVRNFRSDRIIALFDPATGEVLGDPVETLRKHPKYDGGSQWVGGFALLPRNVQDQMEAMGYLASLTDGRADEKANVIFKFALACADVPTDRHEELRRYVYGLDALYEEVTEGLAAAVAQSNDRRQAFVEACGDLAMLDGKLSKKEIAFLQRVVTAFKRAGVNVQFEMEDGQVIEPRRRKRAGATADALVTDTPWWKLSKGNGSSNRHWIIAAGLIILALAYCAS
jgi:hypothetical protein